MCPPKTHRASNEHTTKGENNANFNTNTSMRAYRWQKFRTNDVAVSIGDIDANVAFVEEKSHMGCFHIYANW